MINIIKSIFNKIDYWQDKNLLLRAIPIDAYTNANLILQLLEISGANVSNEDLAKKDMWNHQISQYKMGDDILKNVDPKILDNLSFAKSAIAKYNRSYIFLSKRLRASKELAMLTAKYEDKIENTHTKIPILKYMPKLFQEDSKIAIMATARYIENLKYATILQSNKYFLSDMMNFIIDPHIKSTILKYMDQSLLEDKKFVATLGCFDHLCDNYHNDIEYVSNAVLYDINILKKTKMFDERILKAVLKSDAYINDHQKTLATIFHYIEKFNEDFEQLNSKIKDKTILHKLFWEFGEIVSNEFIW